MARRGWAGSRRRRRAVQVRLAVGALVAVFVLGAVLSWWSAHRPGGRHPGDAGTVTHVVDGDTIDVAGAGRIRIIGIDTPERGECGYAPATALMARLVLGRDVTLTAVATMDDTDRYGRLLRYVDLGDVDAGLAELRAGYAVARYDSRDGYGAHPREQAYVRADAAAALPGC